MELEFCLTFAVDNNNRQDFKTWITLHFWKEPNHRLFLYQQKSSTCKQARRTFISHTFRLIKYFLPDANNLDQPTNPLNQKQSKKLLGKTKLVFPIECNKISSSALTWHSSTKWIARGRASCSQTSSSLFWWQIYKLRYITLVNSYPLNPVFYVLSVISRTTLQHKEQTTPLLSQSLDLLELNNCSSYILTLTLETLDRTGCVFALEPTTE